jgi:histidinol-phosphatase (PHP family)
MLVDYHVHTPYCGHARGKTIEYVERAVELGFDEIGFADHLGRYYLTAAQKRRYWDWGMDARKLRRYIGELEELRALFAGTITIRIGLEIDYVEGAEELLEPILRDLPLDFTLGSIHCLPRLGWHHLTRYSRRPAQDVYREYFRCAQMAAASGLFSSLAHLDFVWRYVPWPEAIADELLESVSGVITAAGASQTAVEVNANGFLWSTLSPLATGDPLLHMTGEIARHHVPVTVGSDAHAPGAVGSAFGDMVTFLAGRAITHCNTYHRYEPRSVPLGT